MLVAILITMLVAMLVASNINVIISHLCADSLRSLIAYSLYLFI